MKMPPSSITAQDIANIIGDIPIEVMDVNEQQSVSGWTLFRWANYFSFPVSRTKLLNVISLEVSQTPLMDQIERPVVIRKIDLIDKVSMQYA
jgi:hypothetical protein